MFELIKVTEKVAYFKNPTQIGVLKTDDGAVIIDSGNDKDTGKRILKALSAEGLTLSAIYNTHSHADHIGGNKYLQSQTGCRIYAPEVECEFIRTPSLEGAYIYGGFPTDDLRHKFILAQESDACPLPENDCILQAIPLPGHSFNMMGYRTSDGVVFLADCLASENTLQKYGITFLYDVKSYLETLEAVKGMQAKLFIPSHAEATENIAPLAEINIKKVYEIAERIVGVCSVPRTLDELLKELFGIYGLNMTFQQYCLVGSTVRSYLAWLKDKGSINVICEDNLVKWLKS